MQNIYKRYRENKRRLIDQGPADSQLSGHSLIEVSAPMANIQPPPSPESDRDVPDLEGQPPGSGGDNAGSGSGGSPQASPPPPSRGQTPPSTAAPPRSEPERRQRETTSAAVKRARELAAAARAKVPLPKGPILRYMQEAELQQKMAESKVTLNFYFPIKSSEVPFMARLRNQAVRFSGW